MQRKQIAWWFWCAGAVLIALSWFQIVSNTVGWIGFGLAMIGSVTGWGVTPPSADPSDSAKPEA